MGAVPAGDWTVYLSSAAITRHHVRPSVRSQVARWKCRFYRGFTFPPRAGYSATLTHFLSGPRNFTGAISTMSTVLAYLDVTTGSQIAAMVAGGFAAVVVTLKVYWNKVLVLLRIRKPEEENAASESASASKQPDAT